MDQNLITAMAGVLGSISGASAAIVTTWISQKSQTIRERAKSETRKREILYGDFITEASHLLADAFDHSLDKQLEVLSCESLHMCGQLVITAPERGERMGLHGIGLKFPASISASISSNALACFPPGEKSCSNSSSQTSLSCRAMNAASLARSSRLNSFTACSISVRLTLLQ